VGECAVVLDGGGERPEAGGGGLVVSVAVDVSRAVGWLCARATYVALVGCLDGADWSFCSNGVRSEFHPFSPQQKDEIRI